jgi:hypothetical protein
VPRLEPAVHGRLAAAGVRAVHQVVVDQRAGLHQLERRDGRHDLVGVGAAGPAEAPVGERGPQPLAALEHEVVERLGDGGQRRIDADQAGTLLGEEHGQRLVDARAQIGDFNGGRHGDDASPRDVTPRR